MLRDLRHLGWFMAVLMPTAIVLTMLTSVGGRHPARLATTVAHHVVASNVALKRYDELRETRRVERREIA